jgi:hypothetical protein
MDEKFCRAMERAIATGEERRPAGDEISGRGTCGGAASAGARTAERRLRNHLAREVPRNLDQRLAEAVPNFREIDRDPRWLQWLTGRDALSGQIRQQLLDDAVAKGNAGRVIAFFRGFLQEAAAGRHGQPGQAAGGNPLYTRAQITQMASLRRKGVYSDAEWAHGRLNLSLLVEKGASSVLWTPTAFQ